MIPMTRTSTGYFQGLIGFVLVLASSGSVLAQETQPASTASTAMVAKDKKAEYAGPTTLVELPPAPMLDEEKKQRLDPESKPMFYPPVRQQRDKYGHPLFDQKGMPVMQTKDNLGYDENGKKLHAPKEKPTKTGSVSISRGILSVDGMSV